MDSNLPLSLVFLTDLAQNNNRQWFDENRDRYRAAKDEFEKFTAELINLMGVIDSDVAHLTPKETIFRIFRDTRFSHDKRPYKTNFGCYFVKGGKKSGNGGYYLHFEPGGSFIAGGCHSPVGDTLKRIRNEILCNSDAYRSVCTAPEFVKYFDEIQGDMLKSYPRGFDKSDPNIDLIRKKQYFVMHNFDESKIGDKQYFLKLLQGYSAMKPLNHFLNDAIEDIT